MPEGIVDDGTLADSGHASGRSQSSRQRPDDVPASWVWDRQDKRWREPRKPGPRAADDVDSDAGGDPGDGGWRADRDPRASHLGAERDDDRGDRPEISDSVRDDVEGLLALLALPVGALAERRDPYCGAVFADSMPAIVTAAAPIVCKSERVVAWLTAGSGGLMDWIGLARALAPVAGAVLQHHVLRTVELDEDQADEPAEPELAGAAA